jgi:hypothetical protein
MQCRLPATEVRTRADAHPSAGPESLGCFGLLVEGENDGRCVLGP